MRLTLLSGDWIPLDLPKAIKKESPEVDVISLGGATEAAIWSIFFPIEDVPVDWRSIPYGKPLANQEFFVLDSAMNEKPDWVPGDLYIGGVGLAAGYWKDQEKTNASFLIHPKSGKRLYKTGDVGRYFPDGTIEFLGRNDSQVKIRGNRVELGEIEAVLQRAQGIKEAVAVVQGEKFGKKRLIAYIVSDVMPSEGKIGLQNELLIDPIARATFKLKQKGLNEKGNSDKIVALSGAQQKSIVYSTNANVLIGENTETRGAISQTQLGCWLSCLKQVESENDHVHHRHYPSAGSLYPVQCFLKVGENTVEGLDAGFYYYDPSQHQLIDYSEKISTELLESNIKHDGCFELYLFGKISAIEPIYGRHTSKFIALESGHILQNLIMSSGVNGVQLNQSKQLSVNEDSILLGDDYQFISAAECRGISQVENENLVTVAAEARQCHREFRGKEFNLSSLEAAFKSLDCVEFDIYLCLHGDENEQKACEIYYFDGEAKSFVSCGDIEYTTLLLTQGIENQRLHQNSNFSIYLTGKNPTKTDFVNAGLLLQNLMNVSAQYQIGYCPVGNQTFSLISPYLPKKDVELVYSFVGGCLDQEQLSSWSKPDMDNQDDIFHDLKKYLGNYLPDYMIPAIFVPVENIPLSRNGKIDRGALPAIEDINESEEYCAPENNIETSIVKIWEQLLNAERIGTKDNLFEIGGDSLVATRMLGLIRKEFGLDASDLSLREIFENPTVKTISRRIELLLNAKRLDSLKDMKEESSELVEEGEL